MTRRRHLVVLASPQAPERGQATPSIARNLSIWPAPLRRLGARGGASLAGEACGVQLTAVVGAGRQTPARHATQTFEDTSSGHDAVTGDAVSACRRHDGRRALWPLERPQQHGVHAVRPHSFEGEVDAPSLIRPAVSLADGWKAVPATRTLGTYLLVAARAWPLGSLNPRPRQRPLWVHAAGSAVVAGPSGRATQGRPGSATAMRPRLRAGAQATGLVSPSGPGGALLPLDPSRARCLLTLSSGRCVIHLGPGARRWRPPGGR